MSDVASISQSCVIKIKNLNASFCQEFFFFFFIKKGVKEQMFFENATHFRRLYE